MMRKLILICGFMVLAVAASAQDAITKELTTVMNESSAAWNNNNLDRYMSFYDANATMMMRNGRVGVDSIRAMYVKYYFKGDEPKQPLAYDSYQVTMLGTDYALFTGRFILKAKGDLKERSGTFSLVFVHRKDGWKILHDHSG